MTRLAGLLAFPISLATILFILLVALQSLAKRERARAQRLFRVALAIVAAYAVVLFAVSLASRERVLIPGQEKFLCDLDCDLALSVARVMPVPATAAGSRSFAVTLRARSDAAKVDMKVPPLEVWVVGGHGRRYDPAIGSRVRFDMPLPPGARGDIVLRFAVPANEHDLKLAVGSGGGLSRFVIGDEESFLHRRTLFALPEVLAANQR